jgi:hypothetical protein
MSNNKVHYAFPHEDGQFEGDNDAGDHGMTLRDYFAAKAMQAMVSSPDMFLTTGREGKNLGLEPGDAVARAAYEIANSMLAERDK